MSTNTADTATEGKTVTGNAVSDNELPPKLDGIFGDILLKLNDVFGKKETKDQINEYLPMVGPMAIAMAGRNAQIVGFIVNAVEAGVGTDFVQLRQEGWRSQAGVDLVGHGVDTVTTAASIKLAENLFPGNSHMAGLFAKLAGGMIGNKMRELVGKQLDVTILSKEDRKKAAAAKKQEAAKKEKEDYADKKVEEYKAKQEADKVAAEKKIADEKEAERVANLEKENAAQAKKIEALEAKFGNNVTNAVKAAGVTESLVAATAAGATVTTPEKEAELVEETPVEVETAAVEENEEVATENPEATAEEITVDDENREDINELLSAAPPETFTEVIDQPGAATAPPTSTQETLTITEAEKDGTITDAERAELIAKGILPSEEELGDEVEEELGGSPPSEAGKDVDNHMEDVTRQDDIVSAANAIQKANNQPKTANLAQQFLNSSTEKICVLAVKDTNGKITNEVDHVEKLENMITSIVQGKENQPLGMR